MLAQFNVYINQDRPNVYINYMRVMTEICKTCNSDMRRMYTRDKNKRFVPWGWLCPKCDFNIQPKATPVPTPDDSITIKEQIDILTRERNEFRELSEKLMQEHPERTFQNATDIQAKSNEIATNMQPISNEITTITTTIPNAIEFPANKLAKFFMASNQCKQFMTLKIEGNRVIGWESN